MPVTVASLSSQALKAFQSACEKGLPAGIRTARSHYTAFTILAGVAAGVGVTFYLSRRSNRFSKTALVLGYLATSLLIAVSNRNMPIKKVFLYALPTPAIVPVAFYTCLISFFLSGKWMR